MNMIDKYGLKISSTLYEFINNEAIPGTELKSEEFWDKFSKVVHELSPKNRSLIEKREIIQKKIDNWHISKKGKEFNKNEYINFLKSVEYLIEEKEIKALETEVENLKSPFGSEGISEVDTNKIKNTQIEINQKLEEVYSNLNSWQRTQVARHEDRPRANYYIKKIFSQFTLLSGDRYFGDDKSVIAGFGLIENKSVLIIGQEKGEDLNSRIERNFGMMRPEGYRKCVRLMKLADRFQIPVISFIDTPGAYPGIGAEQRGQASAIANSIECSMSLTVPNISIIIGEGGSGGAIALASSNKVIMLENSIYSVISPEGCASILWRIQLNL